MSHNNELTLQQATELLSAYTLGVLDQDELLAVDSFVKKQREFFEHLRHAEEKAAILARTVLPIIPPPAIKRTVMMIARYDAPNQDPAPASQPVTALALYKPTNGTNGSTNGHLNGHLNGNINGYKQGAVTHAIAPYRPTNAASTIKRAPVGRFTVQPVKRKSGSRVWQAAAIAALIGLVVFVGLSLLATQRLRELSKTINNSRASLDELRITNSKLQVEHETLATQNGRLEEEKLSLQNAKQEIATQLTDAQNRLQLLTNSDRVLGLRGTLFAPEIKGMMFTNGQQGTLILNGLVMLPENQVYQLWVEDENSNMIPVAIFSAEVEKSELWYEFGLPAGEPQVTRAVLTVESAGGSARPGAFIAQSVDGL